MLWALRTPETSSPPPFAPSVLQAEEKAALEAAREEGERRLACERRVLEKQTRALLKVCGLGMLKQRALLCFAGNRGSTLGCRSVE